MNLKSCDQCGVVVNYDTPGLQHIEIYNHDGDQKCDAVICPVCKEPIASDEWEEG